MPALVTLLCFSRRSDAQPLEPQQIAVAEALVEEGRRLVESGKIDEACEKFSAAVSASDSWATGALAQLAECHERAGRLGSAWATWVKAAGAASRSGQKERADFATARASELDRRVPKLTIAVPDALKGLAGVAVARDGAALPKEQWDLPIRVDPGPHRIQVTAPGRRPWEATLDVRAGEVNILAPARLDELPVTLPSGSDEGKLQRHVGIGVGALGLVTLEVAGALTAVAVTKGGDAAFVCEPAGCTSDAPAVLLHDRAISLRNGAVVTGVLGAAFLASGIAIYATAPSPRPARRAQPTGAGLTIVLGPGGGGVAGRW